MQTGVGQLVLPSAYVSSSPSLLAAASENRCAKPAAHCIIVALRQLLAVALIMALTQVQHANAVVADPLSAELLPLLHACSKALFLSLHATECSSAGYRGCSLAIAAAAGAAKQYWRFCCWSSAPWTLYLVAAPASPAALVASSVLLIASY
jgi:hypothetical protein